MTEQKMAKSSFLRILKVFGTNGNNKKDIMEITRKILKNNGFEEVQKGHFSRIIGTDSRGQTAHLTIYENEFMKGQWIIKDFRNIVYDITSVECANTLIEIFGYNYKLNV